MELDSVEQRDGMRWLVVVGIIAVMLSFALKTVDDKLSSSDVERRRGQVIGELRTAQTGLPGRVTDERQLQHRLHDTSRQNLERHPQ